MAGSPVQEWSQEVDSEGSDTPRSKNSPGGSMGMQGWVKMVGSKLPEGVPPPKMEKEKETMDDDVYCSTTRKDYVHAIPLLETLVAELTRSKVNPLLCFTLNEKNKVNLSDIVSTFFNSLPNMEITFPVHSLGQLPNEVLLVSFSYLDIDSVMSAQKVCTSWQRLCSSPRVWRNLCAWQWPRYTEFKEHEAAKYNRLSIDGVDERQNPLWWKKTYYTKKGSEKDWLSSRAKRFHEHTIIKQHNGIHCIQFDETELMTGSGIMNEIGIWDMRDPHELKGTLIGHTSAVTCLQFDSDRVVSGSLDHTVRIWDRGTDTCTSELRGHNDKVWCVHFMGDRMVSGSSDKTVRVWNIDSGEYICSLEEHRTSVSCVRMDDSIVVSGSAGNSIRVWDIKESPKCVCKLRGHQKGVFCLQFDHSKIISGSLDNTIRVWDRRDSYKNVNTVQAGDDGADGTTKGIICLSYDDTKLIVGGANNIARIWDMRTWKPVHVLTGHTHWITSIQFDDAKLITGSRDHTVKMWNVS